MIISHPPAGAPQGKHRMAEATQQAFLSVPAEAWRGQGA